MRTSFIAELLNCAAADERIWLLNADLGYSVLEPFAERFPGRYVNVGVGEQNMTGIAAGLAHTGKIVFTYSIANFPVLRCLEQIRNDVCYHNLPVRVVSVGAGLAYGAQGYTHHGIEDMAVMQVLPNMTVISPADPVETRLATRQLSQGGGPCYLRLGKAGEKVLHITEPEFAIGKAITLQVGSDAALIAIGSVLRLAIAAAEKLGAMGMSVSVISMPTLKPIDEAAIIGAAQGCKKIVSIEEHGAGGLATSIAEVLCFHRLHTPLTALRLGGEPISYAGSQDALREKAGLSVENIIKSVTG